MNVLYHFFSPILSPGSKKNPQHHNKGTFPLARNGCGTDPGRRPLTAAARGYRFPLWRIHCGTVADPSWLSREWNFTNLVSNVFTHRYFYISSNYRTIYMKWASLLKHNWYYFTVTVQLNSCAHTELCNYYIRHVVLYTAWRYLLS